MSQTTTQPQKELTEERILIEWQKCSKSPAYFIRTYCKIYDNILSSWIAFLLWPAQVYVINQVHNNKQTIVLKSRQLGITWLMLGYALWLMIFRPIATILLFSRRDDEAVYILGKERLKGMYERLPDWMKAQAVTADSDHTFGLSNGSIARAFPANAGDSYTATFALVDEADLVPNLGKLLRSVKPTIDAGGKIALISRANKDTPASHFKAIYRAAKKQKNNWKSIFLAWHAHPGRTKAWYNKQVQDALSTSGVLDDVHEQYPATDEEALAARALDKRFLPAWLQDCFKEEFSIPYTEWPEDAPAIPQLDIFRLPIPGVKYIESIDPAEGNPNSDDSVIKILEADTYEECASLAGKYEPSMVAEYGDIIGHFYNDADVLPERNNHGHAVIMWFEMNSTLNILCGPDGKPGWLENTRTKSQLFTNAANIVKNSKPKIHSADTYSQLSSIEGATLKAPENQHDDHALAYVIGLMGCMLDPNPPRPTKMAAVTRRGTKAAKSAYNDNQNNVPAIRAMVATKRRRKR